MENGKPNLLKEKSFKFSIDVLRFTGSLGVTNINKVLINQLVRSGTSVGANIVEAQGSSSRKEFVNYMHISLKSAHETKYWLLLFLEVEKGKAEQTKSLINNCDELLRMLTSSLLTLKGKR